MTCEDSLTVRFEVTEEDLLHFHLFQSRRDRSSWFLSWVACGLVSGVLLFQLFNEFSLWVASLCAMLYLGPAVPVSRWLTRRRIQQYVRQAPGSVGKASLELTPAGLINACDEGKMTLSWTAVYEVAASEKCLFLYLGGHDALLIPRRAFSSPEAAEVFLQSARAWYAAARAHTAT